MADYAEMRRALEKVNEAFGAAEEVELLADLRLDPLERQFDDASDR